MRFKGGGGFFTGKNNHRSVDCSSLKANGGILIGRMLILASALEHCTAQHNNVHVRQRVKSHLTSTNEWPAMYGFLFFNKRPQATCISKNKRITKRRVSSRAARDYQNEDAEDGKNGAAGGAAFARKSFHRCSL